MSFRTLLHWVAERHAELWQEPWRKNVGWQTERRVHQYFKRNTIQVQNNKIQTNEEGHPIPDEVGVLGAMKMSQLVRRIEKKNLVICIISVGIQLWCLIQRKASRCKINKVDWSSSGVWRYNLQDQRIKEAHIRAERWATRQSGTYPTTIVSLILSDIIEDQMNTTTSGPDKTTFNDAISTLKKYDLWKDSMSQGSGYRLNQHRWDWWTYWGSEGYGQMDKLWNGPSIDFILAEYLNGFLTFSTHKQNLDSIQRKFEKSRIFE